MMRIAAAFGGPDWARALEIMAQVAARSTDAVVAAEFRAMVRALATGCPLGSDRRIAAAPRSRGIGLRQRKAHALSSG